MGRGGGGAKAGSGGVRLYPYEETTLGKVELRSQNKVLVTLSTGPLDPAVPELDPGLPPL